VHASGVYIVQPGDTLYDIAQEHQVSLQKLAEINNITDPTTIMVGQQLLIP
jgi:LysM repeat protein